MLPQSLATLNRIQRWRFGILLDTALPTSCIAYFFSKFSVRYAEISCRFAIPALYTIDRWGRRTLLLITFPQLALTLLAAGICSAISDEQIKLGLVATFVILYTAIYSTGEGPVPFTYSAEVFPLSHRGWSSSIFPGGINLITGLQRLE